MRCEELLATLNEYVDGTVALAVCEQFQRHLQGCNPCRIVVDNIRQTISLYKAGEPFEIPSILHERLRDTLWERWRDKNLS